MNLTNIVPSSYISPLNLIENVRLNNLYVMINTSKNQIKTNTKNIRIREINLKSMRHNIYNQYLVY